VKRLVSPRRAALEILVAAALVAGCRLPSRAPTASEKRAEHERLKGEFAQLAARDPVVTEALAQGGDVVLGARPALVEAVFREVAGRYLDNVVLDLPLEKTIHESRELEVGTFLGKIKAGVWTLDVTIHRVQGRLRARPPRVAVAADNVLTLDVPVVLEEGHGRLTARFSWDSRSVASVVCQDFEVTRRLGGEVLAREYAVSGALRLYAGPERLRADPEFPPREFRIQVDLTDRSWADVRAAIDEQDKVGKCGLALDPDDLVGKIRARLHEGFDVKLPRSLFRPVDFPAGIREDVTIEDRRVDLAVKTRALAVTPVAVWFGADVRTRIGAEGASPSAPAAESPSR
jgi:hypothetical protein